LDLEEIICGYYDDEEKTKDCMASCREELLKFDNLSFEDMFSSKDVKEGVGRGLGIAGGTLVAVAFGAIGLGVRELIYQYRKHNYKEKLAEQVDDLIPLNTIEKSFDPVHKHVNDFISFFKTRFLDELLDPVIKSIEEIQQKECDKELKKKDVEEKIIKLKNKKEKIKIQLDEINSYIKTM
jgi:hypothetical protein